MPRIAYISKRMGREALECVERVNAIVAEYRAQGLVLTLRQVYYQFVSRGWLPNSDRSYKNLGNVINDGRMAGHIDWSAIEDRTRYLRQLAHWHSPADIVEACAGQFRVDHWLKQRNYVEVWVEKDALVGVIEAACEPLDVPHFSCRGYGSQTALWEAGQRIKAKLVQGKSATVFHLGDHDPSGIDMTRDIEDRLAIFTGERIPVERLALNMDQVTAYNPPPNPAKLTDSRCAGYVDRFGDESWELDALEPNVLITLIAKAVKSKIKASVWRESEDEQTRGRATLGEVAVNLRRKQEEENE